MGDINPNISMTTTQTAVDGKIEMNSGSGPVSFDELEEVTKSSKAKARADKKDSNDKPKSETKGSVDLTSDENKGGKSDKKDSGEKSQAKEPEPKQGTQADENAKEIAKARKLIKAKFNDVETDLDEESLVPVKINGVEQMVQIKDLMGNYSGKVAYDKKFTELSKNEKAQKIHEMKLRQAADTVRGIFQEPDHIKRMFKMAEAAGVDPVQFREQFLSDNINLLEKWQNMSEAERDADAKDFQAKYYKQRADTLEGSMRQQQTQRELEAKLSTLRASHNVSDEEFSNQAAQVEQAIAEGYLDKSKATPEYVIETLQKERLWKAVDESLKNLNLPWSDQERNQKIFKLVDDAHKNDFKPEEMADMVSEVWGQKKITKKAEEVRQERQEFMSGKKDVAQMKTPNAKAITFFDDI